MFDSLHFSLTMCEQVKALRHCQTTLLSNSVLLSEDLPSTSIAVGKGSGIGEQGCHSPSQDGGDRVTHPSSYTMHVPVYK